LKGASLFFLLALLHKVRIEAAKIPPIVGLIAFFAIAGLAKTLSIVPGRFPAFIDRNHMIGG
jgi:hypothetical protein